MKGKKHHAGNPRRQVKKAAYRCLLEEIGLLREQHAHGISPQTALDAVAEAMGIQPFPLPVEVSITPADDYVASVGGQITKICVSRNKGNTRMFLYCLCHELVHVVQWKRGDVWVGSHGLPHREWKLLPSEIEACKVGDAVSQSLWANLRVK
jgi:hypothetical protein